MIIFSIWEGFFYLLFQDTPLRGTKMLLLLFFEYKISWIKIYQAILFNLASTWFKIHFLPLPFIKFGMRNPVTSSYSLHDSIFIMPWDLKLNGLKLFPCTTWYFTGIFECISFYLIFVLSQKYFRKLIAFLDLIIQYVSWLMMHWWRFVFDSISGARTLPFRWRAEKFL